MAKLAPAQVEQLRNIGAYLRQMRQEQGRSLDDIATQIFIRPALLQALEEGREDDLPEPIFVQGFIRRYAEALELDGNGLSKEFSVTPVHVLPDPQAIENPEPNGVVEPETRHSIKVLSKAEPPESSISSESKVPLGMIAGLGALALAILGGIWLISSIVSNRPERAQTPAVEPPVPTPTPEVEPPPVVETLEPEPVLEAPVVAEVTVTERSWMSVMADGQAVFEGTMEAGEDETWTAEDSITITSGNAGGVELSFNGNDSVVMGTSGNVETLTLTPNTDPDSVGLSE